MLTPETLSKMAELLDISGERFGELKKDLQKELAARNPYSAGHTPKSHPKIGQETRMMIPFGVPDVLR